MGMEWGWGWRLFESWECWLGEESGYGEVVCGGSLQEGHPGGQGRKVFLGRGFLSTSLVGHYPLLLVCWRSLGVWWGHLGLQDLQQLWGGGIERIWIGMGWTWSMVKRDGMWVRSENERGRGFCFRCCGEEWCRIFFGAWALVSPVGKRILSGRRLGDKLWSLTFQGG